VTLPAGPTVQPVTFNLSTFNPPYTPDEDHIVMAFLTDYQGNLLDTAGRPLSSFQEDPRPAFAMAAADATWDFGPAAQGTLLKRSFSVANTGQLDPCETAGRRQPARRRWRCTMATRRAAGR